MAAARKQKQLNECLLWAADKNEIEKLKYYLKEGATVDKTDAYKRTSLIKAIQNGSIDGFEILIAHGASVNKADVEGETALLHASYKGCFDILCRLIELGADINHKNKNDESAVYISCKYGHYDCVRRLIVVGSDYNGVNAQSKFGKLPMDVAVETMSRARRQNREEKYRQLENIVELLSDSDQIETLQKQEKMFTLTPEEFRLCLERSEYRPSDVNIRVIGLNDCSIQAVTCALIGQLDNCSSEITNGISFHTGICDLNIETGEWIIHDKVSDRDLIYRNMGEVVRHYVKTHNFEQENQPEKLVKNNKFSYLFRSNTAYTPDLIPETSSQSPIGLDRNNSSNLTLNRSKTSSSLYSLKSDRRAISLTGMNQSFAGSTSADSNSNGSVEQNPNVHIHSKFGQFVQNAKTQCSKAVKTLRHGMNTLRHGDASLNTDVTSGLIKNRKQVYDTFECVKSAMQTNNKMLAAMSVSALSARYNFAAIHRLLFTTSAIHIFVLDSDIDFNRPSSVLSEDSCYFTNQEYMTYLVDCITRRNEGLADDHSVIIFVSLNSVETRNTSSTECGLFDHLNSLFHGTEAEKYIVIDTNLRFSLKELHTDKRSILTQHIYTQVCELIEQRPPQHATWLALQESVILARENNCGIINRRELIEICVLQTNNITLPKQHDIEEFLQFQTAKGTLLHLHPDVIDYVCLDGTILYQLVSFFSHVSIILVHDKYESTPLYDKLKAVFHRSIDKTSAKCYISISDPLLMAACSLHFAATNEYRLQLDAEPRELFLPVNMSGLAPDSLIIQFHRFEYSACFGFRLKHAIQVSSLFKFLTCALYEIMPLKQIRGKNIAFKNFAVFTIDSDHCLSLTTNGNTIICNITRNISEKKKSWSSKADVCSGIYALSKYYVFQILTTFTKNNINQSIDSVMVLDTCSLSPPCLINYVDFMKLDSYRCDKHNTFVDPMEMFNTWNPPQMFPMIQVEECSQACRGLSNQALTETVTDSDFARIIRRISVSTRNQLLSSLRAELRMQLSEASEFNTDQQLLSTMIRWRNSTRQTKMEDIQKILTNNGETKHVLCKIFRQPNTTSSNSGKGHRCKDVSFSPRILNQLSIRLITRSLFFALELGVDFIEYSQISHQKENPLKTTRGILSLCENRSLDEIVEIFQEIGIKDENLVEMTMLIINQ